MHPNFLQFNRFDRAVYEFRFGPNPAKSEFTGRRTAIWKAGTGLNAI